MEAEAVLVAADVLAVWWWLEERQLVVAGRVAKTAAVSQSVGSSSKIETPKEAWES